MSPISRTTYGKMPEWSIGTVSKTVVPLRVPRVRIPVFPPATQPPWLGCFVYSHPVCPAPRVALPIPTPHTAPLLLHTPAPPAIPPRHTIHGRPKIFHSKSPAFVVKNHYLYSLHFILQHSWLPQIPPTSALHYSHRTTRKREYFERIKKLKG